MLRLEKGEGPAKETKIGLVGRKPRWSEEGKSTEAEGVIDVGHMLLPVMHNDPEN